MPSPLHTQDQWADALFVQANHFEAQGDYFTAIKHYLAALQVNKHAASLKRLSLAPKEALLESVAAQTRGKLLNQGLSAQSLMILGVQYLTGKGVLAHYGLGIGLLLEAGAQGHNLAQSLAHYYVRRVLKKAPFKHLLPRHPGNPCLNVIPQTRSVMRDLLER